MGQASNIGAFEDGQPFLAYLARQNNCSSTLIGGIGQDVRNHGTGVSVTADNVNDLAAAHERDSFILRRPTCSCDEDGTNRSNAEAHYYHLKLDTAQENWFRSCEGHWAEKIPGSLARPRSATCRGRVGLGQDSLADVKFGMVFWLLSINPQHRRPWSG